MQKFLNYVINHFRFKISHPEETHDRGWEVRWIIFNVAFMTRKVEKPIDNTDKKE